MRQTISCSYELTNDYYSGLIFLWHFVLCHPENSLATYLHLVPLWRVTQKHFGDLLTITPFMTMESEKSVVWLTTNLRFLSLATSGGRTNIQKFVFWTISNWFGSGDCIRLPKQIDLWLTYFMTFRFMTLKFRLDLLTFFYDVWRQMAFGDLLPYFHKKIKSA